MTSTVLFKSEGRNYYLHSGFNNRFLLCHPLIHHFADLTRIGGDPAQWIDQIDGAGIYLGDLGPFSRAQVEYYFGKFLFLKENHYFEDVDIKKKLSDRLSAQSVKTTLANCRQLTFEVTDLCNLDCSYCAYGKFYNDYDRREGKNLPIPVAECILDYLLELWNSPLNHSHQKTIYISFYGGEPLLNFSFIERITYYVKTLKLMHNSVRFSMTTNGLLLNKHMDFLVEHDFQLLVSLDGDEVHNSYRIMKNGRPSFPFIMSNLLELREKYPIYFNKNVRFNAVLHNRNSLSAIFRYFKGKFNKSPNVSEVNPYGIDPAQKAAFRETYRNMNESLNQEEEYYKDENRNSFLMPRPRDVIEVIRRYSGVVFRKYDELLACAHERSFVPTGTCIPFSRMLFVTVNGKILPCERIGHQFSLGRVSLDGVELDFHQIAKTYNRYFESLSSQCHLCHNTEACIQCLFNLPINDPHPKCFGFKNHKDIAQYFSSVMTYMEEHPEVFFNVLEEMSFG